MDDIINFIKVMMCIVYIVLIQIGIIITGIILAVINFILSPFNLLYMILQKAKELCKKEMGEE